jgi:hypothetical protein
MSTANEKRRESCKKVGGAKKREGHEREDAFETLWGEKTATTYKAEADKTITNLTFLSILRESLGEFPSGSTSIKGGISLQFTLGRIPEIEVPDQIQALSQRSIWEKYLGKSQSEHPAHLFAYRDADRWVFFRMEDVIDFITQKCTWRKSKEGRSLKGDFPNTSKKGFGQYLTCEYRKTHKGHFLGANGGQGYKFICLLKENLKFHEEVDK